MKKLPFAPLFLLLALLTACQSRNPDVVTIEGRIEGLGDDTIYLYGSDYLYDRMDTLPVREDRFRKTLTVDTLVSAWLRFGDGTEYPLFMQKGDMISIQGAVGKLDSLQVSGNVFNDELTAFYRGLNARDSLPEAEVVQLADSFISSYPTSLVSVYLLEKYLVQRPAPDYKRIRTLTDGMAGVLKDRPYVSELQDRLSEEEKMGVGRIASTFSMPDANGKKILRSTYKDQYLLIHFWASWDSLSLADNAIYRRIHKKAKKNEAFAMLGVSLDVDRKAWLDAIKRDTLDWDQVCDFSAWNTSDIVKLYAVRDLPANILLAPTGRIEGKNLDEAALEKQLERIDQEAKAKQKQKR